MFTTYEVPGELQPFISLFYTIEWEREIGGPGFNEFFLPSGYGNLAFQAQGSCAVSMTHTTFKLPRFYANGQQTFKYFMQSGSKSIFIVGAALKPTAFWHLFGLEMPKMTNKAHTAHTLFDKKLPFMLGATANLPTLQEQLEILKDALMNQYRKREKIQLNIIDEAVDIILKTRGCLPIQQLTGKLHVSLRYFQKKFKAMVGITPSAFSRITRFNFIFSEMNEVPLPDYQGLSAVYNYYDFPHFSKDFKRFCGEPPTQFAVERFAYLRDIMIKASYVQIYG